MKLVAGTTLWKTACHDRKKWKKQILSFCSVQKITLLYCTENHHGADGCGLASSPSLYDRDPLAMFFFLRVPLLWRYLDRLRGIAGGSLPSAGVQGGRSQRWKLVGKKNDHKVTKDEIKVGSQSQGFFLNCGQPKPPSWGRIFEVRFFWGREKVEFLFETSTFDQEKLPYCLIHRQTEWLNFNSPVPNHISWSDLQIVFQKSLVRWLWRFSLNLLDLQKTDSFDLCHVYRFIVAFGDCILELLEYSILYWIFQAIIGSWKVSGRCPYVHVTRSLFEAPGLSVSGGGQSVGGPGVPQTKVGTS